jgi:hypothetical protein
MSFTDGPAGRGERGCSRWVLYGGAAGVLLLLLFLVASARFMERSVDLVVLRASQRVVARLPVDLPTAERKRTLHNLDRLVNRTLSAGERRPPVRGFLSLAGAILEDDRLTAAEVESLNQLLEGGAPPATSSPTPLATANPGGGLG